MSDQELIHRFSFNEKFTNFHNKLWDDENISWASKSLLAYIISRPKDWKVYRKQLATIYKGSKRGNGLEAVNSMFDELIEHEYIIYVKDRNEKGQWTHSYHAYPLPFPEIKKMFPELVKPVPVNPIVVKTGVVNPNLPNNESKPINEYKKNKQQQELPAAAFPCLLNLKGVSQDEKEWISENHLEPHVEHAVKHVTDPSFVVQTTLTQALKWACNKSRDTDCREPQIKKTATDKTQDNLEYLESLKKHDGKTYGHYTVSLLSKSIEFITAGNGTRYFATHEKDFKTRVEKFLNDIAGKS